MVDYQKSAHTVSDIKYHFVWVTKYRYKVLTGEVSGRAHALLRQICLSIDILIVKVSVGKDHIHMLV